MLQLLECDMDQYFEALPVLDALQDSLKLEPILVNIIKSSLATEGLCT